LEWSYLKSLSGKEFVFVAVSVPTLATTQPMSIDNEIYAYNNKHSLRSKAKGYGGKTH
jgi:hypothetical protein